MIISIPIIVGIQNLLITFAFIYKSHEDSLVGELSDIEGVLRMRVRVQIPKTNIIKLTFFCQNNKTNLLLLIFVY
jgi:hypothetical protein